MIRYCLLAIFWLSPTNADAASAAPPEFEKNVLPILQAKCLRCHGEKQQAGKLDMRTPAAMLRGGNTGPAYKPGNSTSSLLIELIEFNEMPPKKSDVPRVTKPELQLLREWIDSEK